MDGSRRLVWLEDYAASLVAHADLSVPQQLRQGIPEAKEPERFFGFEPLPPRGRPVSNELIDKLREDDLG